MHCQMGTRSCVYDVCDCSCTSTGAFSSCHTESEVQVYIDSLGGCSSVKNQIGGDCANAGPIIKSGIHPGTSGTTSATCSSSSSSASTAPSSTSSSSASTATSSTVIGVIVVIVVLVIVVVLTLVVVYACCLVNKKNVS